MPKHFALNPYVEEEKLHLRTITSPLNESV